MKNNYHITKNGELKRDNNTLLIIDKEGEKHRLPVEQVEAIYSHGQIDFNTRLSAFLNQKGIEIHMFGWNGQYAGSLVPKSGQVSGNTVVEQVSSYNNEIKRRNIASEIVSSCIYNMKTNLKYYRRNGSEDYESEINSILRADDTLATSTSIPKIMGAEAEARSSYYNVFEKEIERVDFDGREYNPPSNEINATISYLNSLLYANCVSAIRKTSLDPTISFLHEPGDRRYSLALDIADLFKPMIVTRTTVRLFNRNQLKPEDDFIEEVDKILLSESGRETCSRAMEKQLDKTIEHKDLNRHVSYQYLLQLESYSIKKHLIGGTEYNAFRKWW
jgi:CRISPR-associated protein Cas1